MAITFRSFLSKPFGFTFIFLLFSFFTSAQVTIWLEDFSGAPPAPGWGDNFTDCDGGGSAMVNNNRFEVNDMEGTPCCPTGPTTGGGNFNEWFTNPINIDGYCNVGISVNYGSVGTFECTPGGPYNACTGNPTIDNGHDQIIFEYSLDGGPWIQFFYLCGSGTGVATIGGLSGSTIRVRILPANKSNGEVYWFDNVEIEGFTAPMLNPVNPIEVCAGTMVNIPLTSMPAGATYTWTNDNTAIGLGAAGSGTPITFTAAAVTQQEIATISVNTALAGCSGPGGTIMVTVNPAPVADDPGDIPVCAGEMVNIPLTGTSGATLNWTNNNINTGLLSVGNGDIGFTANNVATVQTSTVTITPNLNGCPGPATNFLITVSPLPNVNQPNSISACANTLVTVNFAGTSAGTTLNWTNDNPAIGLAASGIGNINFNGANVSAQEVATITVTPTNAANCDGTPRTFTITINPSSVVDPPGNLSYCSGDDIEIIFAGTATGFNWTNNNTGTGILNSGTGDIMTTAPTFFSGVQVSNINVTPTGTCPGPPVAFTVTVQPTTSINAISDVAVCSGQMVNVALSGQPANAPLSWSNSNTSIGLGVAGSGNIGFNAANVSVQQVGLVTVSSIVANCPGPDVTFLITVNPGPTMNPVANIAVCNGNPIIANFSGAGTGATYSWTNNNTAVGLPASGTGNINGMAASPATTQTATISVTPNAGGCAGPVQTFTVTVNAAPTMTDPADIALCAGGQVNVNFTGTTGATYNWTNSNTAIGLGATGTGNISFPTPAGTSTIQTGTITVTPSLGTCPGTPTDFTVTVNPLPTLAVTAVNCSGNLLTYSVTLSSDAPTVTATAGTVTGSAGTYTVDMIPAGTNVTITATSAGNCPVAQTINAPNCNCPSVTAAGNPNNPVICEGVTIPALTVTAVAGLEVDWYAAASGGTALVTNNTNFTPAGPLTQGSYTFYAETRDPATGCISAVRTPVTLTVNTTPVVIQPLDVSVCAGAPVAVIFAGTSGSNYSWTNTNANIGLAISGSGDINYNSLSTLTPTETGTISVTPTVGTCPGTPANFTITINALPTLTVGAVQCAPNLLTYSVTVSSDAATLTATAGVVTGSAGMFTIDQIPADTNIIITATSAANCPATLNITAPNCNCPSVTLATGANNPSICEGATVPALGVTPGTGLVVDWFAAPAGGTALQLASNTYSPAGPFAAGMYTFYAETRDTATGCVSAGRTPVTLTVNATPSMNTPGNINVCPGTPITATFSGTANATFAWTNTNTNIGLGASGTGDIVFNGANGLTTTETGTIAVTPTLGTCPGAPVSFIITINASPTLTIGTVQCAPDLATYSVVVTSNAATVTATAGTVNGSGGTYLVSGIPAGTNVTINATSAQNCPQQQTVTSPTCICPPVAAPGSPNNPSVCAGAPIPALTVTAATGMVVDWFTAATGGTALLSGSNSFTPAGPLSAGMYTFFAETRDPATGCTSTTRTPVILTVNAPPTMTAPANVSVCSGQPVAVNFTGTTGAVFNWTNSNPAIGLSATSGTGNISFTSASGILFNTTATLSVYPQVGTCQGALQNFTITVNALPVLTLGTVQCAPDLQTYSVAVTTNGTTVTATAGTVSGSGFAYLISGVPAGINVIITSTSAANCPASLNVTAPDCSCPPVASPGNPNNPTACQGDPFAPLSVSVSTLLQVNWFAAATGGTALATNTTTFTPAGPLGVGPHTFYAEAVDPVTGCTSTRTPVTVTITNGLTATLTGNTTVCAGTGTTLTASGGNTFNWSTGATTPGISVTPIISTTYTVIVSNNNLCADTIVANVVVNLPFNVTINAVTCDPASVGTNSQNYQTVQGCDSMVTTITTLDLNNCAPEVLVVSDSVDCSGNADGALSVIPTDGFPPYTYTWAGAGLSGSGQIATTGAVEIIEDLPVGDYSVTVTGSNGATVVVTGSVKAPPPVAVTLTTTDVSCFGNNDGTITSVVSGGVAPYLYSWSNSATTAIITGLTATSAYTVTVTDVKGCTGTATGNLSGPPPFEISLSQVPAQCGDQTISFTPAALGGTAPYTTLLDGTITTDIRLKLTAGEHQITIQDDNGCAADTTVFVVIPLAPIVALPADTTILLGQVLDITAQTNLSVWDNIVWAPVFDTLNQATLQQQWQPLTSTAVQITITDTAGCKATATMRIQVRQGDDIFAPNVFTPNEDGRDDFWQIFGGASVLAVEEVRIFDRWGDAVYLWNDAVPLDAWPGWDGKSRDKRAAVGVYVYYAWLKLVNGERMLLKGDITLFR